MIKRRDLVDQFEDIVKQEIKNHQASLLATNISINDIKKDLVMVRGFLSKKIADLDSALTSAESKKKAELNLFEEELCAHHRATVNIYKALGSLDMKISKRLDIVENSQLKNGDLLSLREEFNSFRKASCRAIKDLTKMVSEAITVMHRKLESEVKNVRQEMQVKPCHLAEMKKELLKKIEVCRVDTDGILKEVRAARKASFINEKKIENLYTVNQRQSDRITKLQREE